MKNKNTEKSLFLAFQMYCKTTNAESNYGKKITIKEVNIFGTL